MLCFRCGYGALPLAARVRWPQARVVAQDRDLLDTAFLRRNASALSLGGEALRVAETVFPSEALAEGSADLVLGEASAAAGVAVFARELLESKRLLAPGGHALVLASEKQARDWLPSDTASSPYPFSARPHPAAPSPSPTPRTRKSRRVHMVGSPPRVAAPGHSSRRRLCSAIVL